MNSHQNLTFINQEDQQPCDIAKLFQETATLLEEEARQLNTGCMDAYSPYSECEQMESLIHSLRIAATSFKSDNHEQSPRFKHACERFLRDAAYIEWSIQDKKTITTGEIIIAGIILVAAVMAIALSVFTGGLSILMLISSIAAFFSLPIVIAAATIKKECNDMVNFIGESKKVTKIMNNDFTKNARGLFCFNANNAPQQDITTSLAPIYKKM